MKSAYEVVLSKCCDEGNSTLEIKYGNESTFYGDHMEPEDALFIRDLSWVKKELERAYKIGYARGYGDGVYDGKAGY